MRDLVRLRRLAPPQADIFGVFLAYRHDFFELFQPVLRHPGAGAVNAQFIDIALALGRGQRQCRVEETDFLGLQERQQIGDVFAGPIGIFLKLGA